MKGNFIIYYSLRKDRYPLMSHLLRYCPLRSRARLSKSVKGSLEPSSPYRTFSLFWASTHLATLPPSLWLRMSRSTVLPHSPPMAPSFQLWMTQTTWVSEKLEVSGHHPFWNALCRLPAPLYTMPAVCMTYSTPLLEN